MVKGRRTQENMLSIKKEKSRGAPREKDEGGVVPLFPKETF